ncbi:GHKL domain-containing protein [Acetobacterium paludosum]|uniref:histidine kinase n=1 Tax=Acetobacterium paludosum TaxID=52693 RepID=A0A923HSA0_9FIRM|nr:HAMP domain-containing sensor histidine kinase [Acetobacterium paludosum]MBC3887774.1 GHKL domain-containing protein [Acetobacterium paludosum]
MIKKLKFKFVATMMGILAVVFILIIGSINYVNYKSNDMQNMGLLRSLVENDGVMSKDIPITPGSANPQPPNQDETQKTFTVKIDSNASVFELNGSTDLSTLSEEMSDLVGNVLESREKTGSVNGYRYLVMGKSYGKIIGFLDQRISNGMTERLLITSVTIGSLSLLVFFFISLFLVDIMIKPVGEAFEKQKRFISDASHELKTPLSVISVNADVLENEVGENRYLSYIQSESIRMNTLVNDLLTLARLDVTKNKGVFAEFNLSKAVLSMALTFESTAFEAGNDYQLNIDEGIMYIGEAEKIKQVIAILIDNAIKHADEGGLVKISVKKHANRIRMEVFNTGQGISEDEKEKIFERFYRSDESRSKQTGGYGLGLAIAKSIVAEHKGKIWTESANNGVKFIVSL